MQKIEDKNISFHYRTKSLSELSGFDSLQINDYEFIYVILDGKDLIVVSDYPAAEFGLKIDGIKSKINASLVEKYEY
jgi:hypothetical protein